MNHGTPQQVSLFSLIKREKDILTILPHSDHSEKPDDRFISMVDTMANPDEPQLMQSEPECDSRVLSSVSLTHSIINSYHRLANLVGSTFNIKRSIKTTQSMKRPTDMSGSSLSKLWNIGTQMASETLKATTHLLVRTYVHKRTFPPTLAALQKNNAVVLICVST